MSRVGQGLHHRSKGTPDKNDGSSPSLLPRCYNDKQASPHPKAHAKNKISIPLITSRNMAMVTSAAAAMTVFFWCLNVFFLPQLLPIPNIPKYPFFTRVAGKIVFVKSKKEIYHVASCNPCDNEYTVCPNANTDPKYIIPILDNSQGPNALAVETHRDVMDKFVCPLYPVGVDSTTLRWMQRSIADSPQVGSRSFEGFVHDLLYKPGTIYFVQNYKKYPVNACMPCGRRFTLCPETPRDTESRAAMDDTIDVIKLYERNNKFRNMPEGPAFQCRQYPDIFEGYSSWRRKPLNIKVSSSEPKRLNIVMTGIGRDLTGGPLSIMRFASAMLDKQREIMGKEDFGIRWINIDGGGINGEELVEHLQKYDSLSSFRKQLVFVHDALNPRTEIIQVNPDDLFMSTLYYTSFICHETTKHPKLNNKNYLYFIQDFEPIFFPQDANYLEAMESYRYPHFAIYSTWFLHKWFKERGYGQYQFLPEGAADSVAYASEPAIKPWGKFDTSVFDDPTRTRKLIVYARSHADRNAYDLTIDTLSMAVCEGLIHDPDWEVIGVGALEDYVEYLGQQCGKKMVMKIYENIPEPEYRKIVRSGDVGFSLMVSPHPSLPPFDFASAGLVTVTNSFETKTKEGFAKVSKLFVVSEPYPLDLVVALKEAIDMSEDIEFREAESEKMNWETQWSGERCYGKGLFTMMERWFRTQEPLWDPSKFAQGVHDRKNRASRISLKV